MGLRRQTHKGKARAVVRNRNATPPPQKSTTPFFSFRNFPLIRKKLAALVETCPDRKYTGAITTAPCCRAEQGRVYHCLKYGHEPAKLFDCLNCKQREAEKAGEEWILPLVQLSQGLAVQSLLPTAKPDTGASGDGSTGALPTSPAAAGDPGKSGASIVSERTSG